MGVRRGLWAPAATAAPWGCPSVPLSPLSPAPQEVLLKRAADLAEALYGVPSSNQVGRRPGLPGTYARRCLGRAPPPRPCPATPAVPHSCLRRSCC